jgi:hypothetical protein
MKFMEYATARSIPAGQALVALQDTERMAVSEVAPATEETIAVESDWIKEPRFHRYRAESAKHHITNDEARSSPAAYSLGISVVQVTVCTIVIDDDTSQWRLGSTSAVLLAGSNRNNLAGYTLGTELLIL